MMTDAVDVVLDDPRLTAPPHVGVLSRERSGSAEVVRFSYSSAWLGAAREGFALEPELPPFSGEFFSSASGGLFRIFRDTSPDRWGRVLMERREALVARAEGRKPRRLGEWDFLLGVSDATRVGALRFREAGADEKFLDGQTLGVPPSARLRELQAIALLLDEPDSEGRPEYESWLRQLLAPGSSLGGARPKATFTAGDDTWWIAKFPARQDRHDVGAWEFLAHQLAVRAGIQVPDAQRLKLGGEHHTFAVKRFDREGRGRRLYASAMTLAQRNDGEAASYLDIAQAIQDSGDPEALNHDLAELYRRAVFNVLIGNRDDHLRNHGFLRGPRGWRLAPAFDVNPNPDKDEHTLALGESGGHPSVAALRATRELYRLTGSDAERIEREVRDAFRDWATVAKACGVRRPGLQRLSAVIDPTLE